MSEQIIDLQSDHYFMGEALRQAARAYEAEEVPVGAVVVREGRIIARAFNQVELLKDATAHAEMLALREAARLVGGWRLIDCVLYVTLEPCAMCAGAIVLARFERIVFGAWDLSFYATLRVLTGWPASLMTWDLLFLIPVPWVGPVLAPSIVSIMTVELLFALLIGA